jgi:hypothetical protein
MRKKRRNALPAGHAYRFQPLGWRGIQKHFDAAVFGAPRSRVLLLNGLLSPSPADDAWVLTMVSPSA